MNWKNAWGTAAAATIATAMAFGATRDSGTTINLSGRLMGPLGRGHVEYTQWVNAPVEAHQRLSVTVRGASPLLELIVIARGQPVGEIQLDSRGNGQVEFWSPTMNIPRLRPGDQVFVGDMTATLQVTPGGGN